MARKPSLLQLLIWTSISIVSSHSIGLGGDITALVPQCAQSCLLAFIKSNYPTIDCGTEFSLQCLCPAHSISGFNVGEGALQCLLGDAQLGQCQGQDVYGSAPGRVLNMCSGLASALPNTHPVLTATLVVPPSGAPSLLPPTPSQTTLSSRSTTTSTGTTLVTSTRTPSLTSTPSSSSIGTTVVSNSLSTSTSGSTTGPIAGSSLSKGLERSQIIGIVVGGVAGAIAIAVGCIFLARCLRKRRYSDSESEKAFYNNDNITGSPDPSGSRGSPIFHISPPILRTSRYNPDAIPRAAPPAPPAVQPELSGQTTNVDHSTIGLALLRPQSLIPPRVPLPLHSPRISSPPPVEVPIERKPSKLLPPRPALTLEIPSRTAANGASSSWPLPTTDRESTLTNMTAFADLDSEAAEGGQIWRPPPTDPQSATALYIADKYGNWVLRNDNRQSQIAQVAELAELDTYTPLTKSPIEKQEEAAKMAAAISAATTLPRAPQPAFLSQDPASWTFSRSSSLYSQASAVRSSRRRNSSSRSSSSKSRKDSGGTVVDRSDSKASVTTIQTSSTGGNYDDFIYEQDIARLSQLSPVEESPDPVARTSQIRHPKVPGRLGGATIRYVPPPKRPNFTGSPPGQPSPTLGVVYPVKDSPSAYPPPLNPRRAERPFAPTQRAGSGFTPEPPNVEVFPLKYLSPPNRTQTPVQYSQPDIAPLQAAESFQFADTQQQNVFRTPIRQPISTFTPSPPSAEPGTKPETPPRLENMDRLRSHIASQRTISPLSSRTISSSTSSLLAKRLGSDRAAAFALDPNGRKAQDRWRQQGDDGGLLSPDMAALMSPKGTLPMTPTWQPKLTPTRRGDDLYLNVQ
ncbi:hypothetical protein F5Y19DRAFT_252827 [Xylariaceae sp. FL1651]|nr:hypothetical protein F5Y19DRAFT_252827 [Xylariaceae sp. FL1651]